MTFALDLKKFAEKAAKRADILVGELVTNVVVTVDERSPVGDAKFWKHKPPAGYVGGRFRGNWQLTIGAPASGELNRVDPSGSGTVQANIGAIPEQASGNEFWLTNNVPYALRLEQGWSRQAPQGVVARTAVEFQQYVDDALGKAKRATP